MTDPQDIIDVNRLLAVIAQLQTTRHARYLDGLGMTVSQFSVLSHLSRQSAPISISRTALAVEVLQPAVTKMVRKFETLSWVKITLDPDDKRSRLVEITPQGHQIIGQFYRLAAPDAKTCFENWHTNELTDLKTSLQRIAGWLDDNRLP